MIKLVNDNETGSGKAATPPIQTGSILDRETIKPPSRVDCTEQSRELSVFQDLKSRYARLVAEHPLALAYVVELGVATGYNAPHKSLGYPEQVPVVPVDPLFIFNDAARGEEQYGPPIYRSRLTEKLQEFNEAQSFFTEQFAQLSETIERGELAYPQQRVGKIADAILKLGLARHHFEAIAEYIIKPSTVPASGPCALVARAEVEPIARQTACQLSAIRKELAGELERLVQVNSKHVDAIARQILFARRGNESSLNDFKSCGFIGLTRAIETFDPQRGTTLDNYAKWCILNAVKDEARRHKGVIRVPVSSARNGYAAQKTRFVLTEELKREPTNQEIAAKISRERGREISPKKIGEWLRTRILIDSLDAPVSSSDSDPRTLGDMTADPTQSSSAKALELSDKLSAVRAAMESLSPKEREVLKRLYGFGKEVGDHVPEETLEVIGKEWKLTRERIRQIEKGAVKTLRRKMRQGEGSTAAELKEKFKNGNPDDSKAGALLREIK